MATGRPVGFWLAMAAMVGIQAIAFRLAMTAVVGISKTEDVHRAVATPRHEQKAGVRHAHGLDGRLGKIAPGAPSHG